jgi:hypothetical protein
MLLYHHIKTSASGTGYQAKANLPDDTCSWALQNISSGVRGGYVFDVDEIIKRLGGG